MDMHYNHKPSIEVLISCYLLSVLFHHFQYRWTPIVIQQKFKNNRDEEVAKERKPLHGQYRLRSRQTSRWRETAGWLFHSFHKLGVWFDDTAIRRERSDRKEAKKERSARWNYSHSPMNSGWRDVSSKSPESASRYSWNLSQVCFVEWSDKNRWMFGSQHKDSIWIREMGDVEGRFHVSQNLLSGTIVHLFSTWVHDIPNDWSPYKLFLIEEEKNESRQPYLHPTSSSFAFLSTWASCYRPPMMHLQVFYWQWLGDEST